MKTIIFDFDGTIADSFSSMVEVFEQITKRSEKFSAAEIEQLRSLSARAIIKHLKIRRWQVPRLLIRGRQAMSERIDDILPIAGLPPVLKQLAQDGYKMYVLSTNSSVNINRFLKDHHIASYFSGVYGGAGIFNKAGAIKKLIAKEKLTIVDCIYIGDEVRDIQAAKKAGLRYISVAWGYNDPQSLKAQQPMRLIDKPSQLLDALKSFRL